MSAMRTRHGAERLDRTVWAYVGRLEHLSRGWRNRRRARAGQLAEGKEGESRDGTKTRGQAANAIVAEPLCGELRTLYKPQFQSNDTLGVLAHEVRVELLQSPNIVLRPGREERRPEVPGAGGLSKA